LGITYEALTSDYSNVNFSSARMANLQMARNVRSWQQDILIELFLDRVWTWFTESLELRASNPLMGAKLSTVTWSVPAPQLVDPEREVKAIISRVRAGLIPLSSAIREQGLAPEEVLTQIAADNALLDQLGIVLDSDPRKVSAQGQGGINQKEVVANGN
jgi:capsid protein